MGIREYRWPGNNRKRLTGIENDEPVWVDPDRVSLLTEGDHETTDVHIGNFAVAVVGTPDEIAERLWSKQAPCAACDGTGSVNLLKPSGKEVGVGPCFVCDGTGRVDG